MTLINDEIADWLEENRVGISWSFDGISSNTMEQGKQKWIENKRLQIIKALQLQRHWRNCSCNPEYPLARRLILKRLKD